MLQLKLLLPDLYGGVTLGLGEAIETHANATTTSFQTPWSSQTTAMDSTKDTFAPNEQIIAAYPNNPGLSFSYYQPSDLATSSWFRYPISRNNTALIPLVPGESIEFDAVGLNMNGSPMLDVAGTAEEPCVSDPMDESDWMWFAGADGNRHTLNVTVNDATLDTTATNVYCFGYWIYIPNTDKVTYGEMYAVAGTTTTVVFSFPAAPAGLINFRPLNPGNATTPVPAGKTHIAWPADNAIVSFHIAHPANWGTMRFVAHYTLTNPNAVVFSSFRTNSIRIIISEWAAILNREGGALALQLNEGECALALAYPGGSTSPTGSLQTFLSHPRRYKIPMDKGVSFAWKPSSLHDMEFRIEDATTMSVNSTMPVTPEDMCGGIVILVHTAASAAGAASRDGVVDIWTGWEAQSTSQLFPVRTSDYSPAIVAEALDRNRKLQPGSENPAHVKSTIAKILQAGGVGSMAAGATLAPTGVGAPVAAALAGLGATAAAVGSILDG